MFKEERTEPKFDWSWLGDVREARPNLGTMTEVTTYRLMQFTLRDTLTVAEDLDCSGIPVCSEQICTYDEGFIAGLVSQHTGKKFIAKEVDCWCSGDRVCRFDVRLA